MAAYRRVYDSRHLQVDCQGPGSAPEPYARQSSMGCLYVLSSTPMVATGDVLMDRQTNSRAHRITWPPLPVHRSS